MIIDDKITLLHHFFEQHAETGAEKIALHNHAEKITYLALEQQANQIAWRLRKLGIGRGSLVGILLERSLNIYAVMLGILKTGAAYVPLDPEYPIERINYIIKDCQIKLLVTSHHVSTKNQYINCDKLFIDDAQESLQHEPMHRPANHDHPSNPEDLCYIIYTSGSTGKPKGVQISHANACNYVSAALQVYNLDPTDRVYQGFSISFDASVEEIWLTFAAGATLVPGLSKVVQAGAGLVEFLNVHQVSFLSCVPTLLAMLEPQIASLRLLVLGGEVCPQDLVNRWHRTDLRILNTYGPTEATVVTTYAECHPEKPVTIGKPLPNYEVFILDEEFKAVAPGEEGELFIAGNSLSRGYVNRPDLLNTKFIIHPEHKKRLYRTGDLGKMLENGEIQFTGRADSQIKLRGFRIELAEIESVINEYTGIRKSVVAVHEITKDVQALVAYLIIDKKAEINTEALRRFLRSRLPDFMIPNLFEMIGELPILPSGKVDRKNLPIPKTINTYCQKNHTPPNTALEKIIAQHWEALFNRQGISITADFFYDLGGHSLLAAKVVSLLRQQPELENISMLDIYEHTTIEKLAKKFEMPLNHDGTRKSNRRPNNPPHEQRPPQSKWGYYLCAVGQFFGTYLQFAITSWEFLAIYFVMTFLLYQYDFWTFTSFAALLGLLFVIPPILFIIAIASKWLLLGRIKPGKYPVWGSYYFRWWLAQRIQKSLPPVNFITGSPLMNLYCRLMGAKIGKNCFIGTQYLTAFDLITIGDNSSIGYSAMLPGYIVENGWLKIGSITIGNRCLVGTRAVVGINTTMQDDSALEDLSMMPRQSIIPAKQTYYGSPARQLTDIPPQKRLNPELAATSSLKTFGFGVLHYFAVMFVAMIYYFSYLPGILLVDRFYEKSDFFKAVLIAAPLGALMFMMIFCFGIVIIKKLLLGKVKPGSFKLQSSYFLRCWIVERFFVTRVLDIMADSLYFPAFLRLFGAKIGKRVEMGECPHVPPDLLTMEDESFTASSVSIGIPRVYGGYAIFAPVVVKSRAFAGNISLLPPGTTLGENTLIGCLTAPPIHGQAEKQDTSWLGSPAMFLPKREIFEGFSETETFQPTRSLYVKRILIESIRIILPSIFAFMSLVAIFLSADFLYTKYSMATTIALFPIFDILIMLSMTAIAIGLKWLLVGRLKAEIKPVWSVFIWKYDVFVHLYNEFIGQPILEPLLGTPFVAMILRLLGAKIGKRAFINSKEFAEFDLINIGDDVSLNEECIIQTHLFEDRIFKMSKIIIKNGCNIGHDSVILYDTIMEPHSTLGNLSLLMKGENLPAYSRWEGIPAQAVIGQEENATATVSETADLVR